MNQGDYVQYGCGWCAPESWLNFDASPTLRFERIPVIGRFYTKNKSRFPENVRYGDITKGLGIPTGQCRGVYCSHVLEHLALKDCRRALRNTHALLARGGIFRFVLPDFEKHVSDYTSSPSPDAVSCFMRETYLGVEKRNRSLKGFLVQWLGGSQHLRMWDYKALEQELVTAGFVDIRRALYGDSSDPRFSEVEEETQLGCVRETGRGFDFKLNSVVI